MITTIFLILIWILVTIFILRFFYVSNPPQKVKTIYVGLNRGEWKVVLKCMDQCVKTGLHSDTEEKERTVLHHEIADQIKKYISFEPK